MSRNQTLPAGTILHGKWNGRSYRLERLLGRGANGQVYLASTDYSSSCAIKISLEAAELQGEANIIASLDHKEKDRAPLLLDVDDGLIDKKEYPFYVMRYIPGVPLKSYLKQRGTHWIGIVGSRLLDRLAKLHDHGWIFGDIKNDNVLVSENGVVELVDYGGATALGRSVRQFTEIYDRGYWSAGSRIADQAYDCFAVAVLWIHVFDGKRLIELARTLPPLQRHPRELMKLVRSNDNLKPLEDWMEKAVSGRFMHMREASLQWKAVIKNIPSPSAKREGVPSWMSGLLAASILLCTSLIALLVFS